MMTLNDNEKNFQKKLQKDTEIPVIVRERANQAYHHIENNTAVQKRETNDKNALRWMKTGGKVVAGTAAVLAAGICALSLFLTGCSGEISNDYVTITKYKGVEIDKVDADAVSDNDVEAQINSVLQSKSTTTEVTDRAAQTGDTVTIDYEGKKDGVAFDGGTATDAQLTLGSGQFIDGFEDGVVGHNIGDTFDLDLTFPENYGNEDLAGQAVVFTVTLKGISQTDVPELTDEFVQSVSDTSKTVEEYKKEIKKSLKKNGKENQYRQQP